MTTRIGTTIYANSYSASATHAITIPTVVAGDGIKVTIKWEDQFVLLSVIDSAGGTWAIPTQATYAGAPNGPGGAIARCLSHPGGTNVVITATFATVAAPGTPAAANPILEMSARMYRPTSGSAFADGVAWAPVESAASSTFALATESTTGVSVVTEFLCGYQFCAGVTAGGTPTFTRDLVSEDGTGTTFVQDLLSGSTQNVTPGAAWGALGARNIFLAYEMREVAGSPPPPPASMPPINRSARRARMLHF